MGVRYPRGAIIGPRDVAWLKLWREGTTLQEIAALSGVSRQRVGRRLSAMGMSRQDGGKATSMFLEAREKIEKAHLVQAAKNARHISIWGMTKEAMDAIMCRLPSSSIHPKKAYKHQRYSAHRRGIAWELNFAQWWGIWDASGRWSERGRGKGYCMARWADDGPYKVGNVYICTNGENSSDYHLVRKYRTRIKGCGDEQT